MLTSTQRVYGYSWQKRRKAFLAQHPVCECGCNSGLAATDVDHIIPLAMGGVDDESNWQAMAHGHHSRKTARENGGFGNARR